MWKTLLLKGEITPIILLLCQPEFRPLDVPKYNKKEALKGLFLSSLLYELFLAFRAGDGDLAFAPGNPDLLTAAGAVKVAMLPVLQLLEEQQEFPVFVITFVGLTGKAAEDRPDHEGIGDHGH